MAGMTTPPSDSRVVEAKQGTVTQRTVKHLAVTNDPRTNSAVVYAVCSDDTFWLGRDGEDWIQLQGIPGTRGRVDK